MNIQEYISSGIIETYVVGLASKEEILELESLVAQYPEVKQALWEAEDALLGYAQLNAEEAPKGTKEKIRNTLFNHPTIQQDSENVNSVQYKDERRISGSARLSFYIAIAASLLLIVSIGYHAVSIKNYKREIASLQNQNLQLIAQNKSFIAQIQQATDEVNTLANPALKSVVLTGVPGHEADQALLYWNNTTNEVYLMLTDLPKLPVGKQYQLWAIVDGKPISAGLYDSQESDKRLQKMISIQEAEMFAITIEDEGGSDQPTMEQMVVAGKV